MTIAARPARPSPPGTAPRSHAHARRRVRALAWKARFLVAAAALGLAAAITVGQLRPPPPVLAMIVVAARPVLAGQPLVPADVRLAQVPPQAAPADVLRDLDGALGRVLAVPVSEGTVLSEPVLVPPVGPHSPQGPPGTVVAAVRLGEPALARIVGPGTHVDLLAPSTPDGDHPSDAGSARYLARRALVLPGPLAEPPEASGGLSLGQHTEDEVADLILVAVSPDEAAYLANVAGWGVITAVIVQ